MKLLKIQCSNCGASLDLDLDHLMAFCPNCGQRLLIDTYQLAEIIKEKETTKRFQIEQEYKDKQDERSYKYLPLIMLFVALMWGMVIAMKACGI